MIPPHIQQSTKDNCGLTAVKMILQGLEIDYNEPFSKLTFAEVDAEWTIHLAYILAHHSVKDFTMYTEFVGVNWSLYQNKTNVHELFANAASSNIRVVPVVVSSDNLKRFLNLRQYACILLVNLSLLDCMLCDSFFDQASSAGSNAPLLPSKLACLGWLSFCKFKRPTCDDFVGHFIVLIGYDAELDVFYYRDPGKTVARCAIKADVLDLARSCPGTDNDVIIVNMTKR
jgi:hypothetical protein